MHHIRKPSAASETFITTLAVLFFILIAVLFQVLDREKSVLQNDLSKETKASGEVMARTPVCF